MNLISALAFLATTSLLSTALASSVDVRSARLLGGEKVLIITMAKDCNNGNEPKWVKENSGAAMPYMKDGKYEKPERKIGKSKVYVLDAVTTMKSCTEWKTEKVTYTLALPNVDAGEKVTLDLGNFKIEYTNASPIADQTVGDPSWMPDGKVQRKNQDPKLYQLKQNNSGGQR